MSITNVGFPYEIGSQGGATLTIIDEISDTPIAHFEVPEKLQLDPYGCIARASVPGTSVEVEVVVNDLPPGGALVPYTGAADGKTTP